MRVVRVVRVQIAAIIGDQMKVCTAGKRHYVVTFSFFGRPALATAGVPSLHTSYASPDAQKLFYA